MERYLIAKGNTTLLVKAGQKNQNYLDIAQKAIDNYVAEQVGFYNKNTKYPSLKMMGDELCVNATLAYAKKLGGHGYLKTSGIKNPIKFWQDGDETYIKLPINPKEVLPQQLGLFQTLENLGKIISLGSIAYLCTEKLLVPRADLLRLLCNRSGLAAFGLALIQGDALTPIVYVKKTDTCVSETACGSGSIAAAIFSGRNRIRQTTGLKIIVMENADKTFTVGAKVDKIYRKVNL